MDLYLLIKGGMIGFSIAAPIGPVGILCIRRAISHGRIAGLVTGLGAATVDMSYSFIAAYGIGAISTWLSTYQHSLRLAGGIFLCLLGIHIMRSKPAHPQQGTRGKNLASAYLSTLLITLTNPMTILPYAALMVSLGGGAQNNPLASATLFALGVFIGSTLWWLLLSSSASLLRHRIQIQGMAWINRLSGAIIAAFGGYALLQLGTS